MKKQEIYDALKASGVYLPKLCRFMNTDVLISMYEETFGHSPDQTGNANTANKQPQIEFHPHRLKFIDDGWCNGLNRSYHAGDVVVKSEREYEALKEFAVSDEVME